MQRGSVPWPIKPSEMSNTEMTQSQVNSMAILCCIRSGQSPSNKHCLPLSMAMNWRVSPEFSSNNHQHSIASLNRRRTGGWPFDLATCQVNYSPHLLLRNTFWLSIAPIIEPLDGAESKYRFWNTHKKQSIKATEKEYKLNGVPHPPSNWLQYSIPFIENGNTRELFHLSM